MGVFVRQKHKDRQTNAELRCWIEAPGVVKCVWLFKRTGKGLTHRLQTMMMTTTAMRKTKPAAAEPMMRGSFSWMLVLYSSTKRRRTYINKSQATHGQSHKLKHMDEHLSACIWREHWVTDRHTAGWTTEHLGILTGCMDHFPKRADCARMWRVQTSHLAESVWSERRACLGETQTDQAAKSSDPVCTAADRQLLN